MAELPGRIRSIIRMYEHFADESLSVFQKLGYSTLRAEALEAMILEHEANAADALRAMHQLSGDFDLADELSRLEQHRVYCMRTYFSSAPDAAQGRIVQPAVQRAIDKILKL